MLRRLASTAVIAALALLSAAQVAAQTAPDGELVAFPLELPFEVVATADTDTVSAVVVDASYDACVGHFSAALSTGVAVGDGWTIGGRGHDEASDVWNFGLLRHGRTLYHMVVIPDPAGCRVEIGRRASPTPGGRYRWAFPAMRLSDGSTLRVDPFVIGR